MKEHDNKNEADWEAADLAIKAEKESRGLRASDHEQQEMAALAHQRAVEFEAGLADWEK